MRAESTNATAEAIRLIPAARQSAFVEDVLSAVGVPRDDASIVADRLPRSGLSGVDPHGVVRLPHHLVRLENGTTKAG